MEGALHKPAKISEEMGGAVKCDGVDRGTNQSMCYDVQDGCPCGATAWERNMGGDRCNNDGARDISSKD